MGGFFCGLVQQSVPPPHHQVRDTSPAAQVMLWISAVTALSSTKWQSSAIHIACNDRRGSGLGLMWCRSSRHLGKKTLKQPPLSWLPDQHQRCHPS